MTPRDASSDEARSRLTAALVRVAAADRAALREVYELTSAKLTGVCLRICGDRNIAEDIVQDVYVKIWQRAGRFDASRASPITWMATIARNAAIDWRRSSAARPVAPAEEGEAVADTVPDAEALAITASTDARIHHCINGLEERTRGVIRAAFYDGLSYPELAAKLDVPLGTIKSWVRRGLVRLRSCVGDG